jgi:hypothetical protein
VTTSVFGDPVIVTIEMMSEGADADVSVDDKVVLEIPDAVDGMTLDDVIDEVVSVVDVVDDVIDEVVSVVDVVNDVVEVNDVADAVSVVDDLIELVDSVVLLEVGDCDDKVDAANDLDSDCVVEVPAVLNDEACVMPLGLLRRM